MVRKKSCTCARRCAESQQLIKQQELNLPAILQTLDRPACRRPKRRTGSIRPAQRAALSTWSFARRGGSAARTTTSSSVRGLEPLLQRIHRADRHAGKSPRRVVPPDRHAELVELRRQLQAAVDAEAYEEAARLRDLLRKKEATDESG